MEARPKLELVLSPLDKTLDRLSTIVLVLLLSMTIYAVFDAPTIVPSHFNQFGKPGKFAKTATLVILPIAGIIIYTVLGQIVKFPEIYNYWTKITPENARRQYTIATRNVRFLKLGVLLIFTALIFFTYLTTKGLVQGLSSWFLPFVLCLTLLPTFILAVQSRVKK